MIQATTKGSLTQWIVAGMFLLLAACNKNRDGNQDGSASSPPAEAIPGLNQVRSWLVDTAATEQTAALFYNLRKVAKKNILFGHQDATKRGLVNATTQWANEEHLPPVSRLRSDVKEVTGAYPAVYGHDLMHVANFNRNSWFQYETDLERKLTIDAYNRGGVNTFVWHYSNPVSKGRYFWSDSPVEAVSRIIPGGSHNHVFKQSLKEIADFAKSLIGDDGRLVPVIFRPFHEFDGNWFWWGKAHTTVDQYKQLYRFTVTYLRDSLGVHNFLYAWSPDRFFDSEADLMQYYPGDAYVDLLGMDNYHDLRTGNSPAVAGQKLKIISDYAKKHNKLAAFTETGLNKIPQADWYTGMLQKVLEYQPMELCYVLVWANTTQMYWTPFIGHPAEKDFKRFKQSKYIQFADEMPKMYEIK